MQSPHPILALALAWLAAGCGAPGDPVAGAAVYDTYCTSCHGDDGTLGLDGAVDLTEHIPEHTDAQLRDVIRNGDGDMPPQTSDETEIADCIAYLRETFP